MQVFCNHNSYLLPNGHGYFREESVDIKPTADLFIKSLEVRKPDTEATEQLKAEFANMEQAGITLRDTEGLKELQMDIAPWIAQFILTGKAGRSTMQALQSTDDTECMRHFFNAVDTSAEIKDTLRDEWSANGTIYLPDVEVAMYAMTPALKSGLRYLNSKIFAQLTGREVVLPTFTTNGGPADKNVTNLSDGNLKTFWSSDQRMKKDDWYCIDFKQATDIRTITLLMGGPRAGDFPKAGVFEVSDDGQNWRIIDDEPKGGATVVLNLTEAPVQAHMLRYRITEPNARWMSICEFSVNRGMPAYATTNIEKCAKLGAFTDKECCGINRVMEVFPIAKGEFINLAFPTPVQAQWIEINLENPDLDDWASVELTTVEGNKVVLEGKVIKNRLHITREDMPKEKVTAMRLTNTSDSTQEIKLTLFRMGIPEIQPDLNPYSLVDTDMTTFYNCSKAALNEQLPLPQNTAKIIVIGTADTSVNGDHGTQISEHIREYAVPGNANRINVFAPQDEGKRVYEVLFIHEQ
jgi:hyaluronoglucosaminidase